MNRRLNPRLTDCDYLHLMTLRNLVQPFAAQFDGNLLDYGSGTKPYRELFLKVKSYVGADFVKHDSQDLLLSGDGMLPCESDRFDAVVSFQVLEHVPSPPLFLGECSRVLRPGGILLLTTHGTWPYHPGPRNDDFYRWTGAGLKKELTYAGFERVAVQTACGGLLCLLQQMLVLNDPARMQRSPGKRLALNGLNLLVNSCGLLVRTLLPRFAERGDIVPICYMVRGMKPH